ncbi:MAG: hypothetical protein AAGG80_06650, partial [Pseudomonadota bacterium]
MPFNNFIPYLPLEVESIPDAFLRINEEKLGSERIEATFIILFQAYKSLLKAYEIEDSEEHEKELTKQLQMQQSGDMINFANVFRVLKRDLIAKVKQKKIPGRSLKSKQAEDALLLAMTYQHYHCFFSRYCKSLKPTATLLADVPPPQPPSQIGKLIADFSGPIDIFTKSDHKLTINETPIAQQFNYAKLKQACEENRKLNFYQKELFKQWLDSHTKNQDGNIEVFVPRNLQDILNIVVAGKDMGFVGNFRSIKTEVRDNNDKLIFSLDYHAHATIDASKVSNPTHRRKIAANAAAIINTHFDSFEPEAIFHA